MPGMIVIVVNELHLFWTSCGYSRYIFIKIHIEWKPIFLVQLFLLLVFSDHDRSSVHSAHSLHMYSLHTRFWKIDVFWFLTGENLVFNTATIDQPHEQSSRQDVDPSSSVLDSIFSNVLMAVQRDRRSLERRMTRRMQMAGHFEYAVPRKDIVVDLDTGHWKEKGTICSKFGSMQVSGAGMYAVWHVLAQHTLTLSSYQLWDQLDTPCDTSLSFSFSLSFSPSLSLSLTLSLSLSLSLSLFLFPSLSLSVSVSL